MRKSLALVLVAVLLSSLVAAKTFSLPRVNPAVQYPAHDQNPQERLTIAADPYDKKEKASIFSVDWLEHDIVPVMLVITNDGDSPIQLIDMKVQLETRDGSKLSAATRDDLYRRFTRIKNPSGPSPSQSVPFPLPQRRRASGGISEKTQDEIDNAMFHAKAVEPHGTQSGFVFVDVSGISHPLAGAHLYVTGVRDNSGHEVMYFDISLDKYLSSVPAGH